MKHFYYATLICLISGCSSWFVNEKTSAISDIENTCLNPAFWDSLKVSHSIDSIVEAKFHRQIREIQREPFETEIYYFPNDPEELIAVSSNHYSIRYVYSPKISKNILDGFSQKLNIKEKKRIVQRFQKLIMEFQCEEGRRKSLKFIKSIE